MARGSGLPPSAGRSAGRPAARDGGGDGQPARYIRGLLLGQGLAWLAIAAAGLPVWFASTPLGLGVSGDGSAVVWDGTKLLAITLACFIGAAQVAMAGRMSRWPRLALAVATSVQNVALAASLVLAAFLVMVGGSMLELMASTGLADPVPSAVSRSGASRVGLSAVIRVSRSGVIGG